MEYAYPHDCFDETGITCHHGMTLRDYFAGQALAACDAEEWINLDSLSERCYKIADAMLEARK